MSKPARPIPEVNDDVAKSAALQAAVAESDADPRIISHDKMRDWLLQLADGKFDATPLVPRTP